MGWRHHLLKDAEVVPLGDDLLHVRVRGKESDDAIGHRARELQEQLTYSHEINGEYWGSEWTCRIIHEKYSLKNTLPDAHDD